MDYITINEKLDHVQVIDQEDGVPVKILEEKIAVEEFADAMVVTTTDDHVVLEDSNDHIEIQDTPDAITPKFTEVFIQNKVVELEKDIEVPYNTQVDFVGETLIYKGWAAPGSGTNAPVWRIQRMTFVGSDEDLTVEWAEGDGDFDNIWDDRASLSYS